MGLVGDAVDPDDLIDTAAVAELIGLTNPRGVSVYRKRAGFPAPAIERGRCLLWLRADVEAWAVDRRPA